MRVHQLGCVFDWPQNFDINTDRFPVIDPHQDVTIAVADAEVELRISCQTWLSKAVPADGLGIERNIMTITQQNMHAAVCSNVARTLFGPPKTIGRRALLSGQYILQRLRLETRGIDQPNRKPAGRRFQMLRLNSMPAKNGVGSPNGEFIDHSGAVSDDEAGRTRDG